MRAFANAALALGEGLGEWPGVATRGGADQVGLGQPLTLRIQRPPGRRIEEIVLDLAQLRVDLRIADRLLADDGPFVLGEGAEQILLQAGAVVVAFQNRAAPVIPPG